MTDTRTHCMTYRNTLYDRYRNTLYDRYGNKLYDRYRNTLYDRYRNTLYDRYRNTLYDRYRPVLILRTFCQICIRKWKLSINERVQTQLFNSINNKTFKNVLQVPLIKSTIDLKVWKRKSGVYHDNYTFMESDIHLKNLYVLLTLHPNIMIVFFAPTWNTNSLLLTHLLHSSTCFEHYSAHLQEASCIVTCVLNSHPKRVTIPDAVLIQLSSWRWTE